MKAKTGAPIATAFNGQTDEYNVLRYGEAVDDLLDRINEGYEVTVSEHELTWGPQGFPRPGTYRVVSWDTTSQTEEE